MNGLTFALPENLVWLWALPAAVAIAWVALSRRRAAARRFIEAGLLPRVVQGGGASIGRWVLKTLCVLLAGGAVVVAAARPQFTLPGEKEEERRTERMGRDVCFVIDVSRSMLAEDLKPNRLERSRLWLNDVLEVVRGDRVALVAFAGSAVVKAPLTHDYAFVRMQLDSLSPGDVARGGTNIGDAVRLALDEVFDLKEPRFRDIILITDGEDQESLPLEAAEKAGTAGVRLITLGIGDSSDGARIPITDESGRRTFVTYQGKEVFSRMDAATLQQMALATPGGVFFNVGTGTIELDKIYAGLIASAEKSELGEAGSAPRLPERFQWFIGAALVLLGVEWFIGERRRRSRERA
ncbi:MAG: VWA domain-containing protein [Phycisphaerales bacterium]